MNMKHIIIGFVILILVPLIYKLQKLKFKKPFENKLGVIVFSLMGLGQIFIGVSKLGSEGIKISDQSSLTILSVAILILGVCLGIAFKEKKQ